MAIEPIKKVTIVSPRQSNERLMKAISRLGVMQVTHLKDFQESEEPFLRSRDSSTEEVDEKLHQIDFILNLMNNLSPEEQSFIQGLQPVPLVTSPEELQSVLAKVDLDQQFTYSSELDESYRSAERVINEIEAELKELEPLSDLPFNMADFHFPAKTRLVLGYFPRKNISLLNENVEPWDRAAWEEVNPGTLSETNTQSSERVVPASKEGQDRLRMLFAFLSEDSEAIRKALVSIEFDEIPLPKLSEKISDRIDELRSDFAEYKAKVDEVVEKVKTFTHGHGAGEGRRSLLILKAYWESLKNTQLASVKGVEGKWVHVIGGYIRGKDTEKLLAALRREFPESEVTFQDPGPDEEVPVSITVPHLLKPMQLLVEMFGLPPYKSFDPTPFIQLNFYVFFGICFSDVPYGIMLVGLGTYLAAKTRVYQGLNNFARILLYGGVSSILFGALTGSWFGDLYKPEYLGEGNFLLRLQETFAVIDPMAKTIFALIIALGIGMLNQFYGISLKMYGAIRNRDWMGAFSDGVCWLITLPGFIIIASKLLVDVPQRLFSIGLALFAVGAICLILTQGREIKNPFGRIAGGLVSLYGIMGSYGISAFIGDTLSYCRLLALGLTTSIVAMSFNLIGGMVKGAPYVGTILFILILVIGHLFNFAISVLGAFVHSMRLIFVEFFGRFYETGARPFQPLGFDSPACIMRRPGGAAL
jgi:V/A-type H+-transporting ATPase subunit I